MIPYVFVAEAEAELFAAAEDYERAVPGLGEAFLSEFSQALSLSREYPQAGQGWPDTPPGLNVRRRLMNRFPFGIAYQLVNDRLVILAVAPLRRRPGYWLDRA